MPNEDDGPHRKARAQRAKGLSFSYAGAVTAPKGLARACSFLLLLLLLLFVSSLSSALLERHVVILPRPRINLPRPPDLRRRILNHLLPVRDPPRQPP